MIETTQMIPPLTQLTEDEQMLKDAAADFAESSIKPKVHEMDEAGKLDPDLVKEFFEMGLMVLKYRKNTRAAADRL